MKIDMNGYPGCMVCDYWKNRIETSRARALAGNDQAYLEERLARHELIGHLRRTKHMEAANDAQTR
jgi:hypothetical protein